jgi:G3E family GTPase
MSDQYIFSGSLPENASTYVKRKADDELYKALLDGEYCSVLSSRQSGKSSLRVRTMSRLRHAGVECASIDLSSISIESATQENFYADLIVKLIDSFDLDLSFSNWWIQNPYNSFSQRFEIFLSKILLDRINKNIVIFIDEIDSVLSPSFPNDDFFAFIRSFYEKRSDSFKYKRITFCLLGVLSPSNLIKGKKRTPFNIGKTVSLTAFQKHEVHPLEKGLQGKFSDPIKLVQEILEWTGGQPFLTQKLCQFMLEATEQNTFCSVEQVVKNRIIDNWEAQDEPEHLRTIRNRLLSYENRTVRLLGLYQNIIKNVELQVNNKNEEAEEIELILSGLITRSHSQLHIYNRIYSEIFNQRWVEIELENLRPYDDLIKAWLNSCRHDISCLLLGNELQNALQWERGKSLSNEDHQFLRESQKLDTTLRGLLEGVKYPEVVIKELSIWAGGQIDLIHRLSYIIRNHNTKSSINEGSEATCIEQLVKTDIIENWETAENSQIFINIRSSLLRNKRLAPDVLKIYQRVLKEEKVLEDSSPEQIELIKSGVVIIRSRELRICNRIYASIFDLAWVNQTLNDWRPFAPQIEEWINNDQDESYLLSGKLLEDSLVWAEGRQLSIEEHEFLIVSQILDAQSLGVVFTYDSVEKINIIKLAKQLVKNVDNPQAILKKIFFWTCGQPSLTMNLFNIVTNRRVKDIEGVDKLIQTYILTDWKNEGLTEDLQNIWNYFLIDQPHSFWGLETYKKILQGEVLVDESIEQIELIRLGLVINSHNQLTVSNPIYKSIFNKEWIAEWLEKLWPHAHSVIAWFISNCKDDSQLLLGQSLQNALAFIQKRKLSSQESQFFMASQILDISKIRLAIENSEKEAINAFQKFENDTNLQGLLSDISAKHMQAWQSAMSWSQSINEIKDKWQQIEQHSQKLMDSLNLSLVFNDHKSIVTDFLQNIPRRGMPVAIVTGFLGSGKTTLINTILKHFYQNNMKVAVLIYEFGDINVNGDDQLLIGVSEDLNYDINSDIDDGLVDAVYNVLERSDDRIDYMIIETTGIADPLPIALTFLGTELKDLTQLDSILTVIDAETFTPEHFQSEAALSQVEYGDIIILNKTDLVPEEKLQELETYINKTKTKARILHTEYSESFLPFIIHERISPISEYIENATTYNYNFGCNYHLQYLRDDVYNSIFFHSDCFFDLDKFTNFLDKILPTKVYRAIGILKFKNVENCFYFCLSGKRYELRTYDKIKTDKQKIDLENQILITGCNLDARVILQELGECLDYTV